MAFVQYVASMYFVVTTITTTGYGGGLDDTCQGGGGSHHSLSGMICALEYLCPNTHLFDSLLALDPLPLGP